MAGQSQVVDRASAPQGGRMNSALIVFADGYRVAACPSGLRRRGGASGRGADRDRDRARARRSGRGA
jgi:hypothetical protein